MTKLSIGLDRSGRISLSAQIYGSIRDAIESGQLAAGARLPSWSDLAAQLGVSRGTVRAAYERLIDEQFAIGLGAAGTRVTARPSPATTGWSPRMLRYVEGAGLVVPPRSASGYRLYGPGELQRLRTLRQLLERHEVGLAEVGFARRLREDPQLREAVDEWLAARPPRPPDVPADEGLEFEQRKHEALLAAPAIA